MQMDGPSSAAAEHLVLFTSQDGAVSVQAAIARESIWLTQEQLALVFEVKRPAITKHLGNIYKSNELDEESTCSILEHVGQGGSRTYPTRYYNLDAIIAVGYRINSRRATQFRIWATAVLRNFILEGYALNQSRLETLGHVVRILKRAEGQLDARQVLSVVECYANALSLLDDYDHQRISKPRGSRSDLRLDYEECRAFIDSMVFRSGSALFGREKDDSFRSCLGAIYQTFDGVELYPSAEEKAANLFYFVVKNHSFTDGNYRIGAGLFLCFLDKQGCCSRRKAANASRTIPWWHLPS